MIIINIRLFILILYKMSNWFPHCGDSVGRKCGIELDGVTQRRRCWITYQNKSLRLEVLH